MNRILTQMKLCGVLPCVSAERPETLAEALDALAAQGFPCVEADMTAWMDPDPGAMQPAGQGIETGARVRNRAEALQALQAGAKWATVLAAPGDTAPQSLMTFSTDDGEPGQAPASPADGHSCGGDSQAVVCDAETLEALHQSDLDAERLVRGCENAAQARRLLSLPHVVAVRWPLAAVPGQAREQAENLKRVWAETLGFSLAHLGINSAREGEAGDIAQSFATLLGLPFTPGPASDYAGTLVEVMKAGGRGTHGHIGILTDSLERGMFFARRSGFAFDPDSRKNDASGRAILYYLDREIGGFAVHLLQRQGG